MKPVAPIAIAILIALACVDSASATITFSPPVRSDEGDLLSCVVENLRSQTAEVSAELLDSQGAIVASGNLAILSEHTNVVVSTATQVFGGYCKFTFDGSVTDLRGFVQLFDFGGSNTRLLYPATSANGRISSGATTFTPPVRSDMGDVLSCVVENLSDTAVDMTAELFSSAGAVVDSGDITVPAGRVMLVTSTTSAVFGGYCKFTFAGDTAAIRGFIQLFDIGGSNTRLLFPASTAAGLGLTNVSTFTPPVRSDQGDVLSCSVENLSSQSVEVSATLNDSTGSVVDSGTQTIAAGRVLVLASTTDAVFGAYCRFNFDQNPNTVRGFIQLYDVGGSNTRLLFPAAVGGGGIEVDATTFSPPVRSDQGDVLSCVAENLSGQNVEVMAELVDSTGAVVDGGTLTLTAGRTQSLASTTSAVFGAYCRFEFDGSPDEVRGFVQLYDIGGSNTRLLFAAAEGPTGALPTATPTPGPADTPTQPATPTATIQPTNTPSEEPSATPTAIVACVGDCDGTHSVTVDELITMVNIALGTATVAACEAADGNSDQQVTVDEILTAVTNALAGCT